MTHVVAIFIDGFRYNYMNEENAPFLCSLTREEGIHFPLRTILGFSSSIKATIWTSTYPHTHGLWTYWGYLPHLKNDPPKLYRIFKTIPIIELRVLARHLMRYALDKVESPAINWFMASVPDDIMPFFSRISPEVTSDEEINGIRTLFSILEDNDITYRYFDTPIYNVPHLKFKEKNESFNLIFIPNFDGIGHRWGPLSMEIASEVKKLDVFVREIVKKYANVEDFHILIFSDHGMSRVVGKCDIKNEIDRLHLKQPEDYLSFYDSTLARFWFFNEKAERTINETLQSLDNGKILTEEDKKRLGIEFRHNWYGDTYFLVNTGFEIFPNYFVGFLPSLLENKLRPRRGMHGYDPRHPSQYGIFLYHGPFFHELTGIKNFKIIDIAPLILKLFGIKKPPYFESELSFE